jgi:hypothetical protein
MMTITRNELNKILTNAANADMGRARNDAKRKSGFSGSFASVVPNHVGEHIITGTKIGNVNLTFDSNTKLYSAYNLNSGATHFENGKAAAARTFLAGAYQIELQNTTVVD